jgi:dTDP-4-dehydrorhamnose 3,5-epimerase
MKFDVFSEGGIVVIEPKIFSDSRGYFFESYNEEAFKKASIPVTFRQDNESLSSKGVLRGLHFQNPPWEQGKLVRVASGAVLDVAVDIRKNSPSYGKHFVVELSAKNKKMMWIPPGFAHGFLALEDDTLFLYKCTNVYNKESESGIIWNDSFLNINWGINNPNVSEKDLELQNFNNFSNLF